MTCRSRVLTRRGLLTHPSRTRYKNLRYLAQFSALLCGLCCGLVAMAYLMKFGTYDAAVRACRARAGHAAGRRATLGKGGGDRALAARPSCAHARAAFASQDALNDTKTTGAVRSAARRLRCAAWASAVLSF